MHSIQKQNLMRETMFKILRLPPNEGQLTVPCQQMATFSSCISLLILFCVFFLLRKSSLCREMSDFCLFMRQKLHQSQISFPEPTLFCACMCRRYRVLGTRLHQSHKITETCSTRSESFQMFSCARADVSRKTGLHFNETAPVFFLHCLHLNQKF